MEENQDQNAITSKQKRIDRQKEDFKKQLNKEWRRKSGLSQNTLRKLLRQDTAEWARSILSEKLAVSSSSNITQNQIQGIVSESVVSNNNQETGGSANASAATQSDSKGTASSAPTPIVSGTVVGEMLYWNGFKWSIIEVPSGDSLFVLGSYGAKPFWVATQDC